MLRTWQKGKLNGGREFKTALRLLAFEVLLPRYLATHMLRATVLLLS